MADALPMPHRDKRTYTWLEVRDAGHDAEEAVEQDAESLMTWACHFSWVHRAELMLSERSMIDGVPECDALQERTTLAALHKGPQWEQAEKLALSQQCINREAGSSGGDGRVPIISGKDLASLQECIAAATRALATAFVRSMNGVRLSSTVDGCSVTCILLLRFYLRAALTFAALTVLHAFGMYVNYTRTAIRNSCREAARTNASAADPQCGYSGHVVRPSLDPIPIIARFSIGSCNELARDVSQSYAAAYTLLVNTPDAAFCPYHESAAWADVLPYWLDLLGFLCVFSLLEWLRLHGAEAAERYDEQTATSADFALMLSGLRQGVSERRLRRLLRRDLHTIFQMRTDDVVHIEVCHEVSNPP
jgi:hypothetical protein